MKVPRSLPTGAWIAVGLVTAALVVPGASFAAATMTQIVGGSGGAPVAGVSKANQLLSAPAAPSNYFTMSGGFITNISAQGCFDLGAVPSGKAAVVTGLRTAIYSGDNRDDLVLVDTGATCNGQTIGEFTVSPNTASLPLTPGYAVPAGTHISLFAESFGDQLVADVYVDGYSVPAAAITQLQPTITRNLVRRPKP